MAPSPEQAKLLEWGRDTLRDLPWRATRDPWAILVSEVMAQQTQVDRVVPKWTEFLARWPRPAECAAARLGEVLSLWSGLGYPRRARDLHTAATQMVDRHHGDVPEDLDALLALSGVGPYTARAVLCFAFEHDVAVVDTNIARVIARHTGRRLTRSEVWSAAEAFVPTGDGWWWNQSLMELGARHCRPRRPSCDECPLAATCDWHLHGNLELDPAVGSALVSGRQASFDGSDRQARGRLLDAVTHRRLPPDDVPAACGLVTDPVRARRVADSLVADGLLVRDPAGKLVLP